MKVMDLLRNGWHYLIAVMLFCLLPLIYIHAGQSKATTEQTDLAAYGERLKNIEDKLDKLETWHELHGQKQEEQYVVVTNRLTALELTVAHHEQLLWLFIGIVVTMLVREILGPLFKRIVTKGVAVGAD